MGSLGKIPAKRGLALQRFDRDPGKGRKDPSPMPVTQAEKTAILEDNSARQVLAADLHAILSMSFLFVIFK